MGVPYSDELASTSVISGPNPQIFSSTTTLLCTHANKASSRTYKASSSVTRNREFIKEKSPGTSERSLARVLFTPVYGTKEIGRLPPRYRSQSSESLYHLPTFPYGDRSVDSVSVEGRRVDDKRGLVGRISPHSGTSEFPEVLTPEAEQPILPVSGDVFWFKHSSSSFYQTPGSSCHVPSHQRYYGTSIPRRLAYSSQQSRASDISHSDCPATFPSSWATGEHGEVRSLSQETVHVSGDEYRPGEVLDSSNRSPAGSHCRPDSFASKCTLSQSQTALVSNWQSQPCFPVYTSGTPTCQASAVFCEGQSVQSENTDRPLGSVGHTFSFSSPLVVRSGQAVCRSALTSSGTGDVSPDRCEPGRLGSIPRRASSNGQVVPTGSPTPHIIVGAESSLQGSSSSVIPDLRQVSSPDVRQCHSSGIHQERRRNSLHCFVSGDSGNTALVCKPSCCTETILPSGSSQLHSRPVVSFQSGAGNRMDVALGSVQETPHPISTVGSGSLRNEIEQSAASVCESLPRPDSMGSRRSVTGVGRHEPICIPPLQTHPRSPSEASEISNTDAIDSTGLAEPVLVPRAAGTPPRPTSPNSSLEQTPASTPGEQVPPQSPDAPPSRLATIRSRLRQEGFSGTVAQYAAAPQRRSSLRLYQSHWRAFSTWCTERDLDPCEATVQQIADFLVFLHEVKKFAPSTIANYRSSIASTLGTRDGVPLSFHPCLSQLLKAFATSRPPSRPRVPEWDLSRVLRALRSADFEPPRWETRQDRMRCTWKTVFLLALATTSRRSELQALSRSPRDLVFADAGMSMRVVPGFLAKTAIPGMDPSPIFVPSLTPFSGRDNEDRLLCPVRMVQKYLAFTGGLIPKERLFRKVRGEGNPSSQTIASWIKACVRFTHQHRPDVPVSAHQVRRMSASWAFHGGSHSVDEILEAGTWATHSTFTSFYLADVRLQPDRRFRMQPIVARKQLTRF